MSNSQEQKSVLTIDDYIAMFDKPAKKEQIELALGDTKIAAVATTSLIHKIDIYQLGDLLNISRLEIDRFLGNCLPHIPREDRNFVEPSLAAVFLLQTGSKWRDSKSHTMIIELLTQYLTPQQQQ